MKVKIIFDKESVNPECFSGWGISYLVGENVLFDTGEKVDYTINNLKKLNAKLDDIAKIVISHNHWDHTGGLNGLLGVNSSIETFICAGFSDKFNGDVSSLNIRLVDSFQKIDKGIYTTGCLPTNYQGNELFEQALILETKKGISLLAGCSHPGILEYVRIAKEKFSTDRIYAAIGGFHLIDKEKRMIQYIADQLKKEGVENIGPSHCTGFDAVTILKDYYPNNFFDIKIGREIDL